MCIGTMRLLLLAVSILLCSLLIKLTHANNMNDSKEQLETQESFKSEAPKKDINSDPDKKSTSGKLLDTEEVERQNSGLVPLITSKLQKIASFVAEKGHEKIYDLVGVMYAKGGPVQEALQEKAYDFASDLYAKGAPAQKIVEILYDKAYDVAGNMHQTGVKGQEKLGALYERAFEVAGVLQKHSPRDYWGKAWNIMREVSIERLSEGHQLEAIVEALTEQLKDVLPESKQIDPIEVDMSLLHIYICGVEGKISDLRSLKFVNVQVKESTKDSFLIDVTYKLEKMFLTFDVFYMQQAGIGLNAKLQLQFNENKFTFSFKIPRMPTLITNIFTRNCILRITDFKVNMIGNIQVKLIDPDKIYPDNAAENVLSQQISLQHETMVKKFERAILVAIHKGLPKTDEWVCKDTAVTVSVHQTGATSDMEEYKMSTKMEAHCNKKP